MNKQTLALLGILITGCAATHDPSYTKITTQEIKPITYDYAIPNTSKKDLFNRARDHFATVYGDSRSVIRVQDLESGMILGKGVIDWKLSTGSWLIPYINCSSSYDVRFVAKENKARLQLELVQGIVPGSECRWDLPTVSGYKEIQTSFNAISTSLEKALNGQGNVESLKNF